MIPFTTQSLGGHITRSNTIAKDYVTCRIGTLDFNRIFLQQRGDNQRFFMMLLSAYYGESLKDYYGRCI